MSKRKLQSHKLNDCNNGLEINVMDDPGSGGASHHYCIYSPNDAFNEELNASMVQNIHFQNGPIPKNGINGVTNEALLSILIDRMEGFQRGPFACERNAMVLDHLCKALMISHGRTEDRIKRGVEGKLEP